MKSFIKINPSDNVAVALQPLAKGTVIELDNSTHSYRRHHAGTQVCIKKISSLVIPLLNMVIPLDVQPQKFPQVPGFILTI